jgi:hypothetical protein
VKIRLIRPRAERNGRPHFGGPGIDQRRHGQTQRVATLAGFVDDQDPTATNFLWCRTEHRWRLAHR